MQYKRMEKQRHILERIKRATIAMKKTWGVGDRSSREDFCRKMKIFKALVKSIALYGAKIWE